MNAPFMQLYVGDYLRDTRHLTAEQHGAYLLLLMSMWAHGGDLPNDPKKLARLASCTASRWAKIGADVLAFFEVDGDVITQSRLRVELKKALEKSIKRAEAGMRGGSAKTLKYNIATEANASSLLKHSSEPEPEPTEDKPSVGIPPTKKSTSFDEFWKAYPSKVGKGAARKSYERAAKSIRSEGGDPLAVMIEALGRATSSARWRDPTYTIPNPATWLNQERWSDDYGPTVLPGRSSLSPSQGVSEMSEELQAKRRALLEAEDA